MYYCVHFKYCFAFMIWCLFHWFIHVHCILQTWLHFDNPEINVLCISVSVAAKCCQFELYVYFYLIILLWNLQCNPRPYGHIKHTRVSFVLISQNRQIRMLYLLYVTFLCTRKFYECEARCLLSSYIGVWSKY